jgi:cellulose synthase/poly-beta-1,6-N-acetylglucosamine synthase-like glycosyltransferase
MSTLVSLPQANGSSLSKFATCAPSPSVIGAGVTILLCTLNGERFLPEQLTSLEKQTFKNWRLIASDDGSSDRTKSILRAFQKSFEPGRVEIIDGPRRGAPANFLSLACVQNLVSDFYPFATKMTFGSRIG